MELTKAQRRAVEHVGRNLQDYVEIYELEERKRKPRSVDDEFIDDVNVKTHSAADALRAGRLPAQPSATKCSRCDYRGMCTPGTEASAIR